MSEFEVERDDSFTVVTNNILRDKELSMNAKGLLCTMLSLPPEWDYSFNGLVAICKEGKSAVRNTINELKEAKYIKISQYRSERGYYQYKYTVYRKPYENRDLSDNYPTPENRSTDYQSSVEPNTENQQQLNTNKLNTNELIDKKDKYDKLLSELINDYKEDIISQEDFESYNKDYLYELNKLKIDKENLLKKNISKNNIDWIKSIKKLGHVDEIKRNILNDFVDNIFITEDKNIKIKSKFKNQLDDLSNFLKSQNYLL